MLSLAAAMTDETSIDGLIVEVTLLIWVTVANWTIVKVVVGCCRAASLEMSVETSVTVAVSVSCTVVVVCVAVVVATCTGMKRVDWVMDVRVVDSEMVVKSVTTVGTRRVGTPPSMTSALLADCRETSLEFSVLEEEEEEAELVAVCPSMLKTALVVSPSDVTMERAAMKSTSDLVSENDKVMFGYKS